MINQENIESIYKKLEKDEGNLNIKDYSDLIKLITFDLRKSNDFELSKKIISKHEELLDISKSLLLFHIISLNKYEALNYFFKNINFNHNKIDVKGRNILHYFSVSNFEKFESFIPVKDFIILSNKRDSYGKSPLHYAISNKNYLMVYKILDVFSPNDKKELNDLIVLAAKFFNFSEFSKILTKMKEFDLNINDIVLYKDNYNKSALSECLKFRNFEVAYFLLKNGAIFYSKMDISQLLIDNITNFKVLKMLLSNGINSNQRNKNLDHPLIFLIINKFVSSELKIKIISLFIEYGFNINIRDGLNNNLLHYCYLYKENLEVINYIYSLGIIDNINENNINSKDINNDKNNELKNKYISRINEIYN